MPGWNENLLDRFAESEEIRISSRRRDGSLSNPVIIWTVRVGDELFARSTYGPDKPWYRSVSLRQQGKISADGDEIDVDFETPLTDNLDQVDEAYLQKYRQYPTIVPSCVTEMARSTTIRITPSVET